MTKSYENRHGVTYYLPDFGPPVRWLISVSPSGWDLPVVYYFECDSENLGCRAMHIYEDGRVIVAYPGGPHGDSLPEGELPPIGEIDDPEGVQTREITKVEFDALWAALSRLEASE